MKRKSTRNKPGSRAKRSFFSLSVVSQFLIIIFTITAAYILWLDYRIHSEFEGRKWAVPARVYSRPMDIFPGQRVSREQIQSFLQTNHYQAVVRISGPGQYRHTANGVEVYLRSFDYWGGHVTANQYSIRLSDNLVQGIEDTVNGHALSVLRLEPELIGKIYPDHNEDRILVDEEDVPQFLTDALIAVEDRNFYRHYGIDFRGILRAFIVNLRSGRVTQGGSTLTQQLVKNFFLSPDRSFSRKLNEMIMAVLLERRYHKQEILLAYINEVYLGQNGAQGIHGFGTAAEFYFNRPLMELRQDQIALLVGLVRGASYYNPRAHPHRARERRDLVLDLMVEFSYLDRAVANTLRENPLDVAPGAEWIQSRYPAFLDLVRRQLLDDYRMDDLKNEGLKILTTLDPVAQEKSDLAVRRQLERLERDYALEPGVLEAAVVSVNIGNGEIRALTGGRYPAQAGFNRAVDARRPTGSLIKPFIYVTALANPDRYNLLTVLDDSEISLLQPDGSSWRPDNYDHTFHGQVTLLEALVNSYNLSAVRLGMDVGLENVREILERAGMKSGVTAYPSMLLGAVDLSPLDVAQMYQTLANGGYRIPLTTIHEVVDRDNRPLQRHDLNVVQALDDEPVFLINYLLTRVIDSGTARQLNTIFNQGQILAGKTGTTNDARDSWFAGFDDEILTVTWMGRDDNRPTPFTGATGAMQIWSDFMQSMTVKSLNLVPPGNISWTDDTRIRMDGDACLGPVSIPYTGETPPVNKLPCQPENDAVKSWFNPFNWFR